MGCDGLGEPIDAVRRDASVWNSFWVVAMLYSRLGGRVLQQHHSQAIVSGLQSGVCHLVNSR